MTARRSIPLLMSLVLPLSALAADVEPTSRPTDKPLKVAPQAPQLQPRQALPKVVVERRAMKFTCPEAGELKLRLLGYSSGGWTVEPREVGSVSFARTYGQLYADQPTKVSHACLYEVAGAYTARVGNASGGWTCMANAATGEGKIEYTTEAMTGWTSNVAGTSKPGYLDTKKTSQRTEGQMLVCEHQLGGKAQFFKVYNAPSKIASCEANGRELSCYY